MPSSLQLAADDPALLEVVQRARKLLHRRALVSAAASAVPVPGLDWAIDAALLSRLMPQINELFGLSPEQIDKLPKRKREQVQKAVSVVGSMVVGQFITADLVLRLARNVGLRVKSKRITRFVPLAGQAVSALIGYTAIRYLGEEHIKECIQVVKSARLKLPAPSPRQQVQRAATR